jgi:hypothetical protein
VAQWEAEKATISEAVKSGNIIRASYYSENILPRYCDAYLSLKARSDPIRDPDTPDYLPIMWLLQEDNNSSHGTRNSKSLPAIYRASRGVVSLIHPANSPDFNPIESILDIIRERDKQCLDSPNSIADLKAALPVCAVGKVPRRPVQD